MKLAQLPTSRLDPITMHRVRFPVRHTEPPTRRRPPPLHAYLCSLPPGGTHPAHARAGRRHRARRGNGQTSSAARPPHVPSSIVHDNARTRRTRTPSIGSPCPVDPVTLIACACAWGPCSNTNTVRDARTGDAYSLCAATRGPSQDAQRPTGTTHTAYDMERRIERRRRHTYNKVLQRATHLRPTSHVAWSDPRATLPFVA